MNPRKSEHLLKSISIIIPIFNNAQFLPKLTKELSNVRKVLKKQRIDVQVIFVDDGSSDNSWDEIKKLVRTGDGNVLLRLTRNFGSVAASKIGIEYASGQCFSILSADLQDPPSLIIEMCQAWNAESDIVICKRISRIDPLMSRLSSRIFYSLVRFFVLKDYPKSGFDVFLINSKYKYIFVDSSKFSYASMLVWWIGESPTVIGYQRQKREFGKSQWSFAKKINLALDILLGFSARPLRFVFFLSAIVSFICFVYSVSIITVTVRKGTTVSGWPSLMVVTTLLFSFLFMFLGLLAEYAWRIFSQLNSRPVAVIKEVVH